MQELCLRLSKGKGPQEEDNAPPLQVGKRGCRGPACDSAALRGEACTAQAFAVHSHRRFLACLAGSRLQCQVSNKTGRDLDGRRRRSPPNPTQAESGPSLTHGGPRFKATPGSRTLYFNYRSVLQNELQELSAQSEIRGRRGQREGRRPLLLELVHLHCGCYGGGIRNSPRVQTRDVGVPSQQSQPDFLHPIFREYF